MVLLKSAKGLQQTPQHLSVSFKHALYHRFQCTRGRRKSITNTSERHAKFDEHAITIPNKMLLSRMLRENEIK